MGAVQQIIYPDSHLCECADRYTVCMLMPFITYSMFKVGKEPDIDLVFEVERIRRLICEESCGICDDELAVLKSRLNEITSSKIGKSVNIGTVPK